LKNSQDFVVLGCWTFILALFNAAVFWSVKTLKATFSWRSYFQFLRKHFIISWLGTVVIYGILFFIPWVTIIFGIIAIPFLILISPSLVLGEGTFKVRLKKGFLFSRKQFGNSFLLLILLSLFVALIAQPFAFVLSIYNEGTQQPIVSNDLLDMAADFVKRVAKIYTTDYLVISNIVRQLVYILFLFGILPLIIIASMFNYYSELEKTEAIGLKKQFEKFGKRNRYLETEVDFD